MLQSTQNGPAIKPTAPKPKKPYDGFPLFAHASGRWAKTILGKQHYFGPWRDWQGALEAYNRKAEYLHAGKQVPIEVAQPENYPAVDRGITIMQLILEFRKARDRRLATGEISARHAADLEKTCRLIADEFMGPKVNDKRPFDERLVSTLQPIDFGKFRESLAKGRGPVALGNEVQRARCVFKFASDENLIEHPVKFGKQFSRPTAKTLRKTRNEKPERMFEADELRRIIETAPQPLKAMILLGINVGFGNTDVGKLPQSALHLADGWVTFPRPKTGAARRAKLWPETVESIRETFGHRPKPKPLATDQADAAAEVAQLDKLVFLTRCGQPWAKPRADDPVSKEFTKLLKSLGLHREGLGFYALRHTFRTIADETLDQPAVDRVMGHAPAARDMAAAYRERIDDERLAAVAEHVRKWLWPPAAKKRKSTAMTAAGAKPKAKRPAGEGAVASVKRSKATRSKVAAK